MLAEIVALKKTVELVVRKSDDTVSSGIGWTTEVGPYDHRLGAYYHMLDRVR